MNARRMRAARCGFFSSQQRRPKLCSFRKAKAAIPPADVYVRTLAATDFEERLAKLESAADISARPTAPAHGEDAVAAAAA
jgi:hypothetical protein